MGSDGAPYTRLFAAAAARPRPRPSHLVDVGRKGGQRVYDAQSRVATFSPISATDHGARRPGRKRGVRTLRRWRSRSLTDVMIW